MDIPGYRIIKELGRGGMSIVYLAEQERLSRQVALKVMASNLLDDPSFKERFIKEGRIVARLNHPNIVTIYDIGQAEGHPYLAMEYVEGPNLKQCIQQGMSLEDSIRTVKRIAAALNMLHSHNIVHRDIKPMNILFRDGRYAVLTDFGIAKSFADGTALTRADVTLGTPGYMSPEQARGQKLDGRSDLYSLGAVLYEMLTGKQPYSGEDAFSTALKHITDPIPSLPPKFSFLQPVINQILAKDPKNRYRNGEEFIQSLNQVTAVGTDEIPMDARTGDSRIPSERVSTGERSSDKRAWYEITQVMSKGRKWPWVAGIVALILGGIVSVAMLRGPDLDPQTEWLIEQLHGYANVQIADGRVSEPPGDNAVETYRNILYLSPRDRKAQQALEKLAIRFHNQADEKRKRGKFDEGLALIDKGLLIEPQHAGLLSLRQAIKAQIEAERRRREIASLLRKAEEQFKADQLIRPKDDSALATYRAVLAIDEENEQALNGLKRIVQHFEREAQAKRQAGDLQASMALVTQGLEVKPDNRKLRTLRAAIKRQIEAADRQRKIDQWVVQARQQFGAEKLISPPGDNALETYQKILEIKKNNQLALNGREKIITYLENAARKDAQQNKIDSALAIVDQALAKIPGERRLIRLRDELAQALQKQAEQRSITELLDKAKQQSQQGRLVQPPGDNALESYRKVLAIQADNSAAKAGLKEISNYYLTEAKNARKTGRLEAALSSLSQGLKAMPGDRGLLRLRIQIERQQEDQNKRDRLLADLRAKADSQMTAERYVQPRGNNAYETYTQILEMIPNDKEAQAGVNRIVERLEQLARSSLRVGNYQYSLDYIEQALAIRPNKPELRSLYAQVLDQQRRGDEEQRVQTMLTQADRQLAADNLIKATELYDELLKLAPQDTRALQGKRRIADRYLQLAQLRRQRGEQQVSKFLLERGLQVVPGHPGLTKLLAVINEEVADKGPEQKIQDLLARAEQQMDNSELTTPRDSNAHLTYLKVLELDPNNLQAKQGLNRISDKYLQYALLRQRAGDLQRGLTMIERGLGVSPGHTGLLTLKGDLERELERRNTELQKKFEQQKLERTLNALLNTAQKQVDNKQLVQPDGDNAYETYREVLQLDPNNQAARNGLEAIADRYENMARKKRQEGKLEESLKIADMGLRYYPAHQGLRVLFDELKLQLNRSPQAEEPSKPEPNVPEQQVPKPRTGWRPRGTF